MKKNLAIIALALSFAMRSKAKVWLDDLVRWEKEDGTQDCAEEGLKAPRRAGGAR